LSAPFCSARSMEIPAETRPLPIALKFELGERKTRLTYHDRTSPSAPP
jgi:hypothetical protein